MKTVHVLISGRVQGVGYRAWTVHTAQRLGLKGWVKNRRDGGVEAIFSGPDIPVEKMIAACHSGPTAARVTSINVSAAEAIDDSGFRQRPTDQAPHASCDGKS